ncbi:MAG: hypothetical protein KA383_18330 [Phycisphaerae bacterium]|nr:hypothetical protein [Phycisphaerae bacterium]
MSAREPVVDEAGRATLLTQFLAGHDTPCPVCRYNLRDLTGDRCPECGAPLQLSVGSMQARFGVFLLAKTPLLMTLALALAIYGICLGEGLPPTHLWSVWATMFLGPLEGLAAVWLYRKRVGFMRRRPAGQWWLVAGIWILHGVYWVVGMLHLLDAV